MGWGRKKERFHMYLLLLFGIINYSEAHIYIKKGRETIYTPTKDIELTQQGYRISCASCQLCHSRDHAHACAVRGHRIEQRI